MAKENLGGNVRCGVVFFSCFGGKAGRKLGAWRTFVRMSGQLHVRGPSETNMVDEGKESQIRIEATFLKKARGSRSFRAVT